VALITPAEIGLLRVLATRYPVKQGKYREFRDSPVIPDQPFLENHAIGGDFSDYFPSSKTGNFSLLNREIVAASTDLGVYHRSGRIAGWLLLQLRRTRAM
jgi:hypothetical protein